MESASSEKVEKGQYRMWAVTLYGDLVDKVDSVVETLKMADVIKAVIGREICPETKRPHLQMFWQFKNPKTFNGARRVIKGAHVEPSYADAMKNYKYCSKEKLAAAWGWPETFQDPLAGLELRPWQRRLINIYEMPPEDRKIYWIMGEPGIGKTVFFKSLCGNGKALIVGGTAKDVQFMVASALKAGNLPMCIGWNLTMAQTAIDWDAMEAIKDGLFASPKYESSMCVYNTRHVWVFSNETPDYYGVRTARSRITVIRASANGEYTESQLDSDSNL